MFPGKLRKNQKTKISKFLKISKTEWAKMLRAVNKKSSIVQIAPNTLMMVESSVVIFQELIQDKRS